jgi:hypothetical protein
VATNASLEASRDGAETSPSERAFPAHIRAHRSDVHENVASEDVIGLAVITGVVLVPLAWEYADLRRVHAFSRGAALSVTTLVFPALGIGIAAALPLAPYPTMQWATTIVVTVLLYSAATRAILASVSALDTAPSRSTRG